MENRLIIVEGLPCVGKSTTSNNISRILNKYSIKNSCLKEGDINHPADYEFHAYFHDYELEKFKKDLTEKIKRYSNKALDGYIFPLTKAGDDLELLIKNKIYDYLPWEVERKVMLYGWKRFVKTRNESKVYIFNCCMLQNPMCETMMRFNQSEAESKNYINNIFEIVEKLNPLLIYLKTENVYKRVEEVCKERDDKWLESVIKYHENGAYGLENDIKGFEGYIDCLKERQRRELEIVKSLSIKNRVISNPFENWDKSLEEIELFLDIK